jgi:CubicO group peptidase (beta-lactamase class C family)
VKDGPGVMLPPAASRPGERASEARSTIKQRATFEAKQNAVIGIAQAYSAVPEEAGSMSIIPNPQVDSIFAEWDKTDSPGFALAVSKEGRIVYSRGYGMADLDHNIAIGPTTVFHAASLAKQFTAMAIMLLVEDRKLRLDDDVHSYIPELTSSSAIPPITIEQMLHHISGIRDQWVLATMAGWHLSDDVVTRKDVVKTFVKRMTSLNFSPGTKFSYSNTNYTLASEIVKMTSGMPLSEFCQKRIFEPLEMTSTTVIETHGEIVKNRAYGYSGARPHFEVRMPNYDLTGPTNLQTTVEDLMRWDRNFDLKTVGGDAALSAMQTPVPASDGYGLGLYILTEDGRLIVEHDGRDAGYRSHLIRFPDQQLAVALLCNLALQDASTGELVRKVAAVYLGHPLSTAPETAAADRPTGALASLALADYFGQYYSHEIDNVYTIVPNGSSIAIRRPRYDATNLAVAGPDVFLMFNFSVVLTEVLVQFNRDPQGKVDGFRMDDISGLNRLSNLHFTKVQ